jgi:hypothetical protein
MIDATRTQAELQQLAPRDYPMLASDELTDRI